MSTSTPLIATEEYYLSHDISSTIFDPVSPTDPLLQYISPTTLSKLKALGPSRTRDMRSANISMQILSHIPIAASAPTCQKLNDSLYTSTFMNPDRLAPLALLPCKDAGEAAAELQRCVTKYRFVGGVLGFSRDDEDKFEGQAFDALWKVAERYGVPIALRPLFPTREQVCNVSAKGKRSLISMLLRGETQIFSSDEDEEYEGRLPRSVVGPLVTHFHAFCTASPMVVLRLYLSKAFDRYPNLRLVISQHGHAIPGMLPRIDTLVASIPPAQKPHRKFLHVWQNNVYVSTADTLDGASLGALLELIPIDRVLFGSNYPWEEGGRRLMDDLKESGVIEKEEWEKVAWRNAESLFGVNSKRGGDTRKRALGGKRSVSYG